MRNLHSFSSNSSSKRGRRGCLYVHLRESHSRQCLQIKNLGSTVTRCTFHICTKPINSRSLHPNIYKNKFRSKIESNKPKLTQSRKQRCELSRNRRETLDIKRIHLRRSRLIVQVLALIRGRHSQEAGLLRQLKINKRLELLAVGHRGPSLNGTHQLRQLTVQMLKSSVHPRLKE